MSVVRALTEPPLARRLLEAVLFGVATIAAERLTERLIDRVLPPVDSTEDDDQHRDRRRSL